MAVTKLTPEEFLDLLDRYNTNVKGKSRRNLEETNEDLRNRIAQVAADKKFKGTGITPNLARFKPSSFNTILDWGEKANQIANTMDALQYSSSLDDGTAYPEDKLRAFSDFMYRLNLSAEGMDDVTSDPAKVADIFNYYTQYGIPMVSSKDPDFYSGNENDTYVDYARDIKTEGGIPTFEHYAKSRILNNPSDFGKQVQKAYKPKAVQPSTPTEIQEIEEELPIQQAVQSNSTPATQELSNADWLVDELRKSYKKDPRGFERLGTW